MKQESDKKPINKYEIENIKDGRCDVVFFDLDSLVESEEENSETGEKRKIYSYTTYRVEMNHNQSLIDSLENNYEEMLSSIKESEYEKAASEVRRIRNELLKESDKEVALDRFAFDFPEEVTMTNIIHCIKSLFDTFKDVKTNKWSKYRQELRDLTTQEGFPFNVKFPEKPTDTNK